MRELSKAHLACEREVRLSGGCLAGCCLILLLRPSTFSGSARKSPNHSALWRRKVAKARSSVCDRRGKAGSCWHGSSLWDTWRCLLIWLSQWALLRHHGILINTKGAIFLAVFALRGAGGQNSSEGPSLDYHGQWSLQCSQCYRFQKAPEAPSPRQSQDSS